MKLAMYTISLSLGSRPNSNIHGDFARLPTYVIQDIFTLVTGVVRDGYPCAVRYTRPKYRELISLSSVCTLWRTAALDRTAYWNFLSSSYTMEWNLLMMERSRTSPLFVEISCETSSMSDAGLALIDVVSSQDIMKRVELLRVSAIDLALCERPLFQFRAPSMVRLELSDLRERCFGSFELFQENTPFLRVAKLYNTELNWTTPILTNLTDLSILCLINSRTLQVSTLLDILRRCPALEAFELFEADPIFTTAEVERIRGAPPILLKRLRTCVLEYMTMQWPYSHHALLQYLTIPALEDLTFSVRGHVHEIVHINELIPTHIGPQLVFSAATSCSLSLSFPLQSPLHIEVFQSGEQGRSRKILKTSYILRLPLHSKSFENIMMSTIKQWRLLEITELHLQIHRQAGSPEHLSTWGRSLGEVLAPLLRLSSLHIVASPTRASKLSTAYDHIDDLATVLSCVFRSHPMRLSSLKRVCIKGIPFVPAMPSVPTAPGILRLREILRARQASGFPLDNLTLYKCPGLTSTVAFQYFFREAQKLTFVPFE